MEMGWGIESELTEDEFRRRLIAALRERVICTGNPEPLLGRLQEGCPVDGLELRVALNRLPEVVRLDG